MPESILHSPPAPDALTAALRRQIDENLRRLYPPAPPDRLPHALQRLVERLREF